MKPDFESRGSKNSFLPSSTTAGRVTSAGRRTWIGSSAGSETATAATASGKRASRKAGDLIASPPGEAGLREAATARPEPGSTPQCRTAPGRGDRPDGRREPGGPLAAALAPRSLAPRSGTAPSCTLPLVFRWCCYCQHLMGEVQPLDDFRLTHGICARCETGLDEAHPPAPDLLAKRVLHSLEAASRSGDFEQAAASIQFAEDSGLRPSELLVGVLSPALHAVGKRWECGELTVAEEHRFTAFCNVVLDQIAAFEQAESHPTLVLAPMVGNRHELGLRMLQHLAWERDLSCRRLPVGASKDDIVGAARTFRPRLFGVSASLVESIPAALELACRLREALPAESALALGGPAFRVREVRSPQDDVRILRTVDEFLAWIEYSAPGAAPATRSCPADQLRP